MTALYLDSNSQKRKNKIGVCLTKSRRLALAEKAQQYADKLVGEPESSIREAQTSAIAEADTVTPASARSRPESGTAETSTVADDR